ncbi:MAG: NAD(P)-dependent oxidoreductase [Proteobacteria bacterium]|nr:NAD(P)-dependent oxidoreductase [Burkholderiales bacterium]
MTRRLVEAGFEVCVFDIDESKRSALVGPQVRAADSLAELTRRCTAVILAVFDTSQVEQVLEGVGGMLDSAAEGARLPVVICTSTCDPDRLAALSARVHARGLSFLEAPLSGTSRQMAAGDAVGLIGGDRAVVEESAAVLDAICPARHYVGALGNGSRAKLVVNLILGLNRAAIAEGLVFAERLGLDREAMLGVARASAAYSSVMETKGPLMARREFANPQSRVDQSLKDFKLMLQQAEAARQLLPFAAVYVRLLEDCVQLGQAAWDNAAIVEAIARRRHPD